MRAHRHQLSRPLYQRGLRAGSVVLLTVLLAAGVYGTSSASPGGTATAAPTAASDTASDTESAVDEVVQRAMADLDIPGAAVAVVHRGEVIALEGYGYADRASQTPVDPESTVFRVGSVSKALTSLAVHQQLEQGSLALTDPAADHVAFDIPTFGDTEVDIASLLTHTSGLENPNVAIAARTPAEVDPLGTYLPDSVPDRFEATGIVHSYTNWGYGLAGHLVEQASGEAFPTYTDRAVFEPLGMTSTSFAPALPDDIADRLATGYSGTAGDRMPEELELYLRAYPAGGAVTTAADMVALMRDLLDGADGVIAADTTAEYLATIWRAAPTMPGRTAGGMEERFISDHRTLVQGGDIFTYSAQLAVVPEQELGVFLAYNTFDDQFREDVTNQIVSLVLAQTPGAPRDVTTVAMDTQQLAAYEGTYRWTNYPRNTMEKVVAATPPYNTTVSTQDDGTLAVSFMGLEDRWTYRPIGAHSFAQVSGETVVLDGVVVDPGERIAFTMRDGEPRYLNISLHTIAAERTAFALMGIPQLVGIAMLVLLFAASLVVWPLGALVRTVRSRAHLTGGARWALWLAIGVAAALLAGFAALFAGVSSDIVYGMTPVAVAAPTLLSVAAVGGLALVPAGVLAWRGGWFTPGGRVLYSVLALAAPVILWWTWYWNLLGWQW